MKIMQVLLLLLFVAFSSAAGQEVAPNPDSKAEGSPNAHLRGALSAEGVPLLKSDSYRAGEEEGRFETGAPEFLSCIGPSFFDEDCCSKNCCTKMCRTTMSGAGRICDDCIEEGCRCREDANCCSGLTCEVGGLSKTCQGPSGLKKVCPNFSSLTSLPTPPRPTWAPAPAPAPTLECLDRGARCEEDYNCCRGLICEGGGAFSPKTCQWEPWGR